MKTALKVHILLALVLGTAALAHAQGTAFQYQGRLNYSGNPATGSYDFRFTIFDSSGGGIVVAGPQTTPGTGVTNGVFIVTLDFGAGVFTGPARWLEIGVRTNGAVSYANLIPRQPLLPTPYAIHAGTASNVVNGSVVKSLNNLRDNVTLAAGANVTLTPSGNTLTIASAGVGGPWSLNGASAYYSGGNVGVGTTTPAAALEVNGLNGNRLLYVTAPRPNLIFHDTIAANARSVMGGFGGGFRFYTESAWSGANPSALMALDNNGNFGLGTAGPQSKLDIDVGSGQDALRMSGNTPFLTFLDTTVGYRSRIQASGGDVLLLTEGAINGTFPNAFLRLRGNGNVGIGTAGPLTTLDVRGSLTLDAGGDAGLFTGTGSLELNRYLALINSPNLLSASGLKAGGVLVSDSYAFANPGKNDLIVKGNVGIGTATPARKLTVVSSLYGIEHTDGNVRLSTYVGGSTGGGWLGTVSNHKLSFFVNDGSASLTVDTTGNVGIGTASPTAQLEVNGTTRTRVLTITGGADLAEPFEMSHDDIPKGSVVVIDDEHPGRLMRSERAYDRRVAGIVSGANGINPGITLQQEGALADGQNVALSGRVYVLADATDAPIKAGDLLTTSDTRGHAMKAADHAKAQGAILGKAMSGLKEGKGMVFVLVTLQ